MALEGPSSSLTSPWKYHVFLSFRGQDTRRTFTDHLYAAFIRKGMIAFRDDEQIRRGEVISQELFQAIQQSLSAVIVLSPNYASSTWCLDELHHILRSKAELGLKAFPVFYGVDPSHVRNQSGSFAGYFRKHENKFSGDKKKVQRWRDALKQVANLSGWDSNHWHEAELIEDIVEKAWIQLQQKLRSSVARDLKGLCSQTGLFTLPQIKAATNNFDESFKIGEGGFGPVYKGVLSNGTIIAVKQLSSKSRQGNREFINEIGMISALEHRNLVKLYGFCMEEDQLLLIYEYMENNNLAQALFVRKEDPEKRQLRLDWQTRQRICIGIAKGLAYLHGESRLKIVHRDIKATNVLLDKDLNPKISDFGLARLNEEDKTHISTRIAGTYGYMAPEYAMHGYLTDKADVYSFGIVALEIVSGTSNTISHPQEECFFLCDRVHLLKEKGNLMELVDWRLGGDFNKEEASVMINVALLCTNCSPMLRPTMSSVVSMLEGRTVVQEVVSNTSEVLDDKKFETMRQHYQHSRENDIMEAHSLFSLNYRLTFLKRFYVTGTAGGVPAKNTSTPKSPKPLGSMAGADRVKALLAKRAARTSAESSASDIISLSDLRKLARAAEVSMAEMKARFEARETDLKEKVKMAEEARKAAEEGKKSAEDGRTKAEEKILGMAEEINSVRAKVKNLEDANADLELEAESFLQEGFKNCLAQLLILNPGMRTKGADPFFTTENGVIMSADASGELIPVDQGSEDLPDAANLLAASPEDQTSPAP